MNVISAWFKRYLSDPQVVILGLLLAVGFATIMLLGRTLAPVIAGIVIAYLLEGVIGFLERYRIPRLPAVTIVFSVFFACLVYSLFGLLPLLSGQITQFFQELPNMIVKGQQLLLRLPELYPETVSEALVREIITAIRNQVAAWGQEVLSHSLAFIPDLITLLVYVILVPMLVFFFLKDKDAILEWIAMFLPHERRLAAQVWKEMNEQIGNYVRGKFLEILIVALGSYVVFALMGLNYAVLLGALVGLSTIVPYIGAISVTIPVAMVAYFQWGWSAGFAYSVLAYTIIQVVDGNLLVPLIFSEVVNLHFVAIILALLVFGDMWGFWGIFFAIPLATLVQAVITAWPRATHGLEVTPDDSPSADAPEESEAGQL
jgi:putative permease